MAKWRRLAKQSRLAARLHCNAKNIDIVLAGNDFPIVHTARAFDPTARQAAQQERRQEKRQEPPAKHVREDDKCISVS
jgi:hypothetical protein